MLLHAVLYYNSPFICLSGSFLCHQLHAVAEDEVTLLSISIHRTVEYNRSFTVSACPYWNKFLQNIKNIDKRALFGAEVKSHLRVWGIDTCFRSVWRYGNNNNLYVAKNYCLKRHRHR